MKSNKIVIGLTGEIASGKSIVSDYLIKKYNAKYFKLSDPLRDILSRLNIDITRKSLNILSTNLRKLYGEDILVSAVIDDIEKSKNKIVVVDGVRKKSEVKLLNKLKNFVLIYVTANEMIRLERLANRKENIDDKKRKLSDFKKYQAGKSDVDIPKIGKLADYQITNNNTLKQLKKDIENLFDKII